MGQCTEEWTAKIGSDTDHVRNLMSAPLVDLGDHDREGTSTGCGVAQCLKLGDLCLLSAPHGLVTLSWLKGAVS